MKRKDWNVNQFACVNLPEMIGTLSPHFNINNGIRVLDLPIHMPGQGWKIPSELKQFRQMIDLVRTSESRYGDFESDHYVYITVDQKIVQAGNTGRRPGAHSDAYIEMSGAQIDVTHESHAAVSRQNGEVSHTYIAYSSLPTEFFPVPFPLVDTSDAESLRTFDEIADSTDMVVLFSTFNVLRLDPFVVHRCAICSETHFRTFAKISVSRHRFARQGNTINPDFRYDWKLTARSPDKRNSPWS